METDPKFLEWMGQMLLLSAKNMEQANKFMKWFREGFPEGSEWEKWLEPYIQLLPQGSEKGAQELRSFFEDFFENMGIVSRKEYLDLEGRYQEIKKELDELKARVEAKKPGFDPMGEWGELIRSLGQVNSRLLEEWQKFLSLSQYKNKK